jgi:hypothetical protein
MLALLIRKSDSIRRSGIVLVDLILLLVLLGLAGLGGWFIIRVVSGRRR